jgi:hypothetical protein
MLGPMVDPPSHVLRHLTVDFDFFYGSLRTPSRGHRPR